MVEEVRQITLNAAELMRALECYRAKNASFLPPGVIVDFSTSANQTFKVMVNTEGGIRGTEFTFADLLEPVICFCIESGVPLPRASRKSVEMHGSNAMLKIVLTHPSATGGQQSSLMPPTVLS